MPGKSTRTQALARPHEEREVAEQGVASATLGMPFGSLIQNHFGRHDISAVRSSIGGAAATASGALGAHAYAHGDSVAFASAPDLHTAAHEAAHVVQQRGIPQRKAIDSGGGDAYEQHADRVADLVVRGQSAESALDEMAGQRELGVQRIATDQVTYVVERGDTLSGIAAQFSVTTEALVEANRELVKTWETENGSVQGFNAGVTLVIPTASEVADPAPTDDSNTDDSEGGLLDGVWDAIEAGSEAVEGAIEGAVDAVTGAVGGLVDAGREFLFGDDVVIIPGTGEAAEGSETEALSDERVSHWVEVGRTCNDDKREAGKSKQPFNVEQIDEWLTDLAADMAKSVDPVQLRVLAGVQFQLESTKHGTLYEQADRDFDFEETFDCSEAVQWMMRTAGLGDIFEEATEEIATLYMSGIIEGIFDSGFRAAPRAGDIMMWEGHTGMVLDVREDERIFLVSHMGGSGSWLNAFDLDDPTTVDRDRDLLGSGQWGSGAVLGYWAPEDATLPSPIGEATIVKTGYTPHKYFKPDTDCYVGSAYDDGEAVEILKDEGEMLLVRRLGSGGAAWVRSKNIDRGE